MMPFVRSSDPILNPPAITQSINTNKEQYSFPKNYKNLKDKVLTNIINNRHMRSDVANDVVYNRDLNLTAKQSEIISLQEKIVSENKKNMDYVSRLESATSGSERRKVRKLKYKYVERFHKDFLTLNDAFNLTLLQETSDASNTPSRLSTNSNSSYASRLSQEIVMNDQMSELFQQSTLNN